MQSRIHNFPFDVNFNFSTENLLLATTPIGSGILPPEENAFKLLDETFFLLLDGTDFLLL